MQPESRLTETQNGKTMTETSLTETENSQTTLENSLTETITSKTGGEVDEKERLIEGKTGKKGGRPPKPVSSTAVTWSVRGVERETRSIIEKAAERAGKNLGQYLNDDVRGFAQGQLSQAEATGQALVSPRDLQVQVEQLTQMVEGIAARMNEPARKSFWQRVFGK
ncbi:hypothetical protein SAMN02745146_0352 [Hymenobacter daecheongensis DSM 21074]|uniref:Uncharacterized protein n=1 Tax=Hymenobacter daecheongensis DSM 21074 TaxID=1121955 RepID=A0A1M6MPG6_9BACT|nr:hypothetical protein [Hymenobacter daecheongensis]SHJ85319.1 hypothetical protein SAMN02745146_0352 [Hymenobacter daecheongensis DSM 21074]